MKRRTKILCMILASAMVLGGCGKMDGGSSDDNSTSQVNESASQGETGESSEETESEAGDSSSMLTITIAKQLDENAGRYEGDDDINNNPMTRLAEEKLGLKMETTLLGGDASNYDTKLRLALTGSEDLPDVFPVYGTQMISDMIESGRVKDITEDIEKYMPDRLKEIYDKYPETFYPLTKDGKIYGIACTPCLTDEQVMVIRQDWLDNLGLEAPTNMDEFEAVIKAFTEDDPDGNGQKDTYGFTYAGDSIYNTGWVADPVNLFSAYSGKNIPGMWYEDENGDLMYGSIHEGNKKALERMAEWHANGWIFQEAAATGAWDVAFGTGDFRYGYIQDLDYDILDDGSVVFDSTLFDPPVTDPFMPGKSTVLKNSPAVDGTVWADIANGKTPETGAEISAAASFETAPAMAEGFALANVKNSEELLSNMFNAEPTETMKKSWEQLQTMEKQVYTNIIYGNEPVEAFDKFVEDWMAQGGEQITREVNEWYQTVK